MVRVVTGCIEWFSMMHIEHMPVSVPQASMLVLCVGLFSCLYMYVSVWEMYMCGLSIPNLKLGICVKSQHSISWPLWLLRGWCSPEEDIHPASSGEHVAEHVGPCAQVKATLRYGELINTADMVCAIAIDRDDEMFATAGVSRRIKVRVGRMGVCGRCNGTCL
jgi:hypothetical protein